MQVQPSRYVRIELFCALTGYTDNAVRTKMSRGVWLEGRQYVRRGGEILMDLEGYETWAKTGVA
jgi:hypothetical protein